MSILSTILGLELDAETIESGVLTAYVAAGGEELQAADPRRMVLASVSALLAQQNALIELAARRGLVQYSDGDHLVALGSMLGVARLDAAASQTTLRWTLTGVQPAVITIPAGTRATDGTYLWATDEVMEIAIGDTTGDVGASCTTLGDAPNGLVADQIVTIVDPITHVASVTNTTTTADGSDEETDEELRVRIQLAPSALSTAGTRDGYDYWTRTAHEAIDDTTIVSPTPGAVTVTVLLEDGVVPGAGVISDVEDVLAGDAVGLVTDTITVQAPSEVQYAIGLTYYVATSDSGSATDIQAAVDAAILAWIAWQRAVMGRDVNPSKLIQDIMAAGAKRVVLTNPAFAVIDEDEIAVVDIDGVTNVVYGGLEAD